MQTSDDFVRQLRERYPRAHTNYGLAKLLGLTPQAIDLRNRRGGSFSDETGERIAELLDLEPAYVLACLAAERAKRPSVRAIWHGVARQFEHRARVGIFLIGLVVLGLFSPGDAAAAAVPIAQSVATDAIYIMRQIRRAVRAAGRALRNQWHIFCQVLGRFASTAVSIA